MGQKILLKFSFMKYFVVEIFSLEGKEMGDEIIGMI